MPLEPVEWSDPAFERRVGPLGVAASHALYELFYELCIEGDFDLAAGVVAARGCWWTWLVTTPVEERMVEIVDHLASRPLSLVERWRITFVVWCQMTVSNKERKAFAVAAQSIGLRYAVPLKRFYRLGARISCAMNVLERSGL